MVIRGLENREEDSSLFEPLFTSNFHLIKYGGKQHNRTLWKVCESDHKAILETLKCKVDLVGSLD